MQTQSEMFEQITGATPPTTRFQGSKLKLLPWIWENVGKLDFESALDAFGGTGSVSYMLKAKGKRITFNDYLRSNYLSAVALLGNSSVRIGDAEIQRIVHRRDDLHYDAVVEHNFSGIYFTDEENRWIDLAIQNIRAIDDLFQRALAYHALFQSCIVKRPYNLFHRKNLYMRIAEVERSFGNKATWDTPFEEHFRNFLFEANGAIFESAQPCSAICGDVFDVKGTFDLIYIDTPYLNASGVGVDYFEFYHFLEGLATYDTWEQHINRSRKHHPLRGPKSPWSDPRLIHNAFRRLFAKFADSILVVSYRSDGIPSETELFNMLREYKHQVSVIHFGEYKYALSKNGKSKEILFIAR